MTTGVQPSPNETTNTRMSTADSRTRGIFVAGTASAVSGTDGDTSDPPPSSDPRVSASRVSTWSVPSCRSRAPTSKPIAPNIGSRRAPTAATRTRPSSATGCGTSCCRSWKPTTRASVRFWRTPPRCWQATTRCCAGRWRQPGRRSCRLKGLRRCGSPCLSGADCRSACSAPPSARRSTGCGAACATSTGSTSSGRCGWRARATPGRRRPSPRDLSFRSATTRCASPARARPGRWICRK